jgi:hypothetical protein
MVTEIVLDIPLRVPLDNLPGSAVVKLSSQDVMGRLITAGTGGRVHRFRRSLPRGTWDADFASIPGKVKLTKRLIGVRQKWSFSLPTYP